MNDISVPRKMFADEDSSMRRETVSCAGLMSGNRQCHVATCPPRRSCLSTIMGQ